MPRLGTNRAAEMEVFVRVVDLGGFTAAAREFRLTPSGVSKLVSRLEGRLSARLVNRSTRRLQLTPEGQAFYDRAVRVLADMDEAEREAAAGACPQGHLRVNSNIPFGMRHVMPLVPLFLERHPEVTLDCGDASPLKRSADANPNRNSLPEQKSGSRHRLGLSWTLSRSDCIGTKQCKAQGLANLRSPILDMMVLRSGFRPKFAHSIRGLMSRNNGFLGNSLSKCVQ